MTLRLQAECLSTHPFIDKSHWFCEHLYQTAHLKLMRACANILTRKDQTGLSSIFLVLFLIECVLNLSDRPVQHGGLEALLSLVYYTAHDANLFILLMFVDWK